MHSVNQDPCEIKDYNYPNFIDREIEAQKGQISSLFHNPDMEA